MARTLSNMLPLGTTMPVFKLQDVVSGNYFSSDSGEKKPVVIMFICNHCPYVIHINDELVKLASDYIKKGISFLAINSNDATLYPEDSPEKMKEYGLKLKYPFPYLYDESQQVAKAFDAACTPDFYIFDEKKKLVYRGQLCESRPSNGILITGKDMRSALDNLLNGTSLNHQQIPSIGCNIKWRN